MSRTAVVTGCTGAIGREIVRLLAEDDWRVFGLSRASGAGRQLCNEIDTETAGPVEHVDCDLARFDAVESSCSELADRTEHLRALVHSASAMRRAPETTEDGFEYTYQVNYAAPYLMTARLAEALIEGAPSSVIVLTSEAHRNGEIDEERFGTTEAFGFFSSMANTSLARVMFALELADRLGDAGVHAHAVHPGLVPSGRQRRNMPAPMRFGMWVMEKLPVPFKESPREAAWHAARLVLDDEFAESNGLYFEKDEAIQPAKAARSPDRRRRLWNRTAEQLGVDWDVADRSERSG